MKIGIPRALLYYRYHVLWNTFFQELGIETVISPHTNKTLMDAGSHYAIDENCLSSKLFFGHVSDNEDLDAVIVEPGFLLCNVCFLCSLPCLIRFLVGFSCFCF